MRFPILYSLLLLLLLASNGVGQVKDAKKFSNLRVSKELRDRLANRFNLFVEYERTDQFDKLYALLPSDVRRTTTQETYVQERRKARASENGDGRLLALKVHGIDQKLRDKEWVGIYVGATLLLKDGRAYDQAVSFVAYLQNGDWYFSITFVEI